MQRLENSETIKLSGFNNLTKCLSFNIYDFCTASTERERQAYLKYVNERYSAERISDVLRNICGIIEAKVLAVSDQNYEPWGASSLVLMSDLKGGGVDQPEEKASTISNRPRPTQSVMHLDKSHICAHTYPDFLQEGPICSIRVDIDIATCGEISPLNALNYMLEQFDSDVVVVDYVVRGYTRDETGKRIYMDHPLTSVRDYINSDILQEYYCIDHALPREHIWQTKMLRTALDEQSYFLDKVDLQDPEVRKKIDMVKSEMREVLHME
jgi:S-adenosylmethionine decarboxylase